jgi:RNA recognition motif-containing protein
MKNLFVGNMSFQTTADDLRALFEPFGQLARVHVATDRETGRARGFGFVEMPNDAEAAKAIAALDGKDVGGRNLKVNEARPKSESGGSGPRGPRGGSGGDRGGKDDNRGNTGGPRGSTGSGGRKERFSNEDYREVARQPREPRW